jgi:Fic family protein
LYLSLYLKQHRAEYYRLLDAVRHDGDWEAWVTFFLEGVNQSATSAVETAHRLLALFQADKQRVQSIGRQSGTTLKVFDALCQRPIGTIGDIAKRADVSFATSSRAIETLKRLDIVNEITGRARDRVFVYRDYVMILNEGAELT